ncbi:cysteine desulfurase DndA [Shewanella acanthi]|uniref:cysteine desulfurase DndA n=1 Tax=Shewanella acanthi TaxID=2864212 RepID=UPI001C65A31E|nr:cysteine desulfurase DndA [Shewanella acanthi]QYJ77915.1 cysteine desulfurase DndA [Shewanella acanthi]
MTVYLDCNATTPMSPEVSLIVGRYLMEEFGNAGSRTHEFGVIAKQAVEQARQFVAEVVDAEKSEVIFTSGATESNNLAILGLKDYAEKIGKKHIITTRIEHKAVLEPIEELVKQGFEVTYLNTDGSGIVSAKQLSASLRADTFLVSIMHVNNETGSIQQIEDYCEVLSEHEAFFHVDAAQSFGKLNLPLRNKRLDLISVSGHKFYAPKGVGALICRRRGFKKPPLKALMFGGGQEKGLRPGTLPVALIAGLGEAARQSILNADERHKRCEVIKLNAIERLHELGAVINGANTMPHVLNFSIPGLNSETAMVALKGLVAVSNGSACTSSSYTPSHVLTAMGLDEENIENAIRMSWCYMTKDIPWDQIIDKLKQYL